jgi:Zn-dependent protease
VKCEFCGKEEPLPFVCNYCGGAFCPDHRLPETHQCKGDLTQKRMVTAPPQTTFSWQSTPFPEQAPARVQGKVFSRIEIRDIIVAWLALGVAFSFVVTPGGALGFLGGGVSLLGAAYVIGISLITVGTGFVFHELSHKFVAQRYGYWAEFRMWPFGLVLALLTSFLGVIFAAPGATYISGMNISKAQNGKISLAGPLTNIAIAVIFLPFLLRGTGVYLDLGIIGVRINVFLALFNMLPIGPLDGSKVFRWSLPIWAIVFISLGIAFYFLYFVSF